MNNTNKIDHEMSNQNNYHEKAKDHDALSLASTLYLAYRDINMLLDRHLYHKLANRKVRFLDFGCGAGLSTEIVFQQLNQYHQYDIQAVGVDINESNLDIARKKLPFVEFKCISKDSNLDEIGQFDLIICNFVLVEMKSSKFFDVLNLLKKRLSSDGILIVTNPTATAYRPENKWYTFNNQFPENIPTRLLNTYTKLKYHEDQEIKVQVFAAKNSNESFTFFDYFHSGDAYRAAYKAAGFELIDTHKPKGHPDDRIEWEAESTKSPYKIHILRN